MYDTITLSEALTRLDRILPSTAPDVWETLRPPVGDEDLDALRAAAAPFELRDDLVTLLRWHDGQERDAPWWPVMASGSLLGATASAAHYELLCGETEEYQWHRSWLPIAHEQWHQAGIELAGEYPGLIVDAGFPEAPTPLAPSLTAMLHATINVLEAGIPADLDEQADDESQYEQRETIMAETFSAYGNLPPEDLYST